MRKWMEKRFRQRKGPADPVLCTASLEMAAAILLDVRAGDEVVMPSYAFTSPPPTPLCCAGAKVVVC